MLSGYYLLCKPFLIKDFNSRKVVNQYSERPEFRRENRKTEV